MSRKVKKFLALFLCFCFIFEQSSFAQVAAQLDISSRIASLRSSLTVEKFRPLHLRSLAYEPQGNSFNLLLDKGDAKELQSKAIEETTRKLLQYFFIGVSLPNESFWVNLRPDTPESIIDPFVEATDIGKVLLEADLQLKKDTANATNPSTPEGKEYWEKLYQKAEELFGNETLQIPTLTRPWIVPGEIIVRETPTNAYIYKATLKVLLEQDYLKGSATYSFNDPRLKVLNEYASGLIRELILPKLTKEVNTAKRYASLRQVYYSLILAQWFKQRFQGQSGLYPWLINQKNLAGITSTTSWSKDTYYQAYKKSFADGEYNLQTPTYTPYGQTIRSYFSGGIIPIISEPLPSPGETLLLKGGGSFSFVEAGPTRQDKTPQNPTKIIRLKVRGGTTEEAWAVPITIIPAETPQEIRRPPSPQEPQARRSIVPLTPPPAPVAKPTEKAPGLKVRKGPTRSQEGSFNIGGFLDWLQGLGAGLRNKGQSAQPQKGAPAAGAEAQRQVSVLSSVDAAVPVFSPLATVYNAFGGISADNAVGSYMQDMANPASEISRNAEDILELRASESRRYWYTFSEYRTFLYHLATIAQDFMQKMGFWVKKNVAAVYYPLGGYDVHTPLLMFPDAQDVISVGRAPFGTPDNIVNFFRKADVEDKTGKPLSGAGYYDNGYDINQMQSDYKMQGLGGLVLARIACLLKSSQSATQISRISYFELTSEGNVRFLTREEIQQGRCNNAVIEFTRPDSTGKRITCRFWYLAQDLGMPDKAFKQFSEKINFQALLIKAAHNTWDFSDKKIEELGYDVNTYQDTIEQNTLAPAIRNKALVISDKKEFDSRCLPHSIWSKRPKTIRLTDRQEFGLCQGFNGDMVYYGPAVWLRDANSPSFRDRLRGLLRGFTALFTRVPTSSAKRQITLQPPAKPPAAGTAAPAAAQVQGTTSQPASPQPAEPRGITIRLGTKKQTRGGFINLDTVVDWVRGLFGRGPKAPPQSAPPPAVEPGKTPAPPVEWRVEGNAPRPELGNLDEWERTKEVNLKVLPAGTLVYLETSRGREYLIRIESGQRVAIWYGTTTGCYTGPASLLGEYSGSPELLNPGWLVAEKAINLPYFIYNDKGIVGFDSPGRNRDQQRWLQSFSEFRVLYPPRHWLRPAPAPGTAETPPASPDSRGFSNLPNETYSPPIQAAIDSNSFRVARFTRAGGFDNAELTLDGGGTRAGQKLDSRQLSQLSQALQFLAPEDQALLEQEGATILFIDGLDEQVRAQLETTQERAPPHCYGSHYGIQRCQYYLDTARLANPQELAQHLHHEIQERHAVIQGLLKEGLIQPGQPIPPINALERIPLRDAIQRYAQEAHGRLVGGEGVSAGVPRAGELAQPASNAIDEQTITPEEIRALGREAAVFSDRPALIQRLAAIIDGQFNDTLKQEACMALGDAAYKRNTDAIAKLREVILGEPNNALRAFAIEALSRTTRERYNPPIQKIIGELKPTLRSIARTHPDSGLRKAALRFYGSAVVYGFVSEQDALELLPSVRDIITQSADTELKKAAMETLGSFCMFPAAQATFEELVPVLQKIIRNPQEIELAMAALGSIGSVAERGNQSAIGILKGAITEQDDPRLRRKAIAALVPYPDFEYSDEIVAAIEDMAVLLKGIAADASDPYLRLNAMVALRCAAVQGGINAANALEGLTPDLKQRYLTPGPKGIALSVRYTVILCLEVLASRRYPPALQALEDEHLLTEFKQVSVGNQQTRRAIVRTLKYVAKDSAWQAMEEILVKLAKVYPEGMEEDVRELLRACREGDAYAAKSLAWFFLKSKDARVRLSAIKALETTAGLGSQPAVEAIEGLTPALEDAIRTLEKGELRSAACETFATHITRNSRFDRTDSRELREALKQLFDARVHFDGLRAFAREVIEKRDISAVGILNRISYNIGILNAEVISSLIKYDARYETKRDGLAYLADLGAIVGAYDPAKTKPNVIAVLETMSKIIAQYTSGQMGDKAFLTQMRAAYRGFTMSLLGEIIGRQVSVQDMEEIWQRVDADKLSLGLGLYYQVDASLQKKLQAVVGKLFEYKGDRGKLNDWLNSAECEWNKEELELLGKAGYDVSLWKEGITVEQEVATMDMAKAVMQLRAQTQQLIERAETLGIAVPEEIKRSGLNSHEEARRFVQTIVEPRVNAQELQVFTAILAQTLALEEEYQSNGNRRATVRVEIKKDFLDDISSGQGVPGCFNPSTGGHKEMPIVHALEANGLFLRAYIGDRMIANAVIVLTDQAAVVFPLYNARNLDLDSVVFNALAQLSRKVPKIALFQVVDNEGKETYVSTAYQKAFAYRETAESTVDFQAVKRERVQVGGAYHDMFEKHQAGNSIFDRSGDSDNKKETTFIVLTESSIRRNGGFAASPAPAPAVQAKAPAQAVVNWDDVAKTMVSQGLQKYLFIIGQLRKNGTDTRQITLEYLKGLIVQKAQISDADVQKIFDVLRAATGEPIPVATPTAAGAPGAPVAGASAQVTPPPAAARPNPQGEGPSAAAENVAVGLKILESTAEARGRLPVQIRGLLNQLGLSPGDVDTADKLIEEVRELYKQVTNDQESYHHMAHNLTVPLGILLLAKGISERERSNLDTRDAKILFLAGLLHDFHLRDKIKQPSAEETLRQLRRILRMPTKEPTENRFWELKDSKEANQLRALIPKFLGIEDIKNNDAWLEIEALIRGTDYSPDAEVRERIKSNFEDAMEKVSSEREKTIRGFASLLFRGADMAGFYWLLTPQAIEQEIMPGLAPELHLDLEKDLRKGSYTNFFIPNFLSKDSPVLDMLANLPDVYKENFVKVMGYFAGLANQLDDWRNREPEVRKKLGLTVAPPAAAIKQNPPAAEVGLRMDTTVMETVSRFIEGDQEASERIRQMGLVTGPQVYDVFKEAGVDTDFLPGYRAYEGTIPEKIVSELNANQTHVRAPARSALLARKVTIGGKAGVELIAVDNGQGISSVLAAIGGASATGESYRGRGLARVVDLAQINARGFVEFNTATERIIYAPYILDTVNLKPVLSRGTIIRVVRLSDPLGKDYFQRAAEPQLGTGAGAPAAAARAGAGTSPARAVSVEPAQPVDSGKGGIDLTALPIVIQPATGQTLPLQPNTYNLSPAADINRDAEWQQIQNMINAGIIPSNERIKEYLMNCCQEKDFSREIDKVLACIADILRLEEERCCTTEPALREFLVLLEQDKPAQELQAALARINVEAKEPEVVGN